MEHIVYHTIMEHLIYILIDNQHGNILVGTQLISLVKDLSLAMDHQKQVDAMFQGIWQCTTPETPME